MNKTTTNEETVHPLVTRIKVAIDMHLKNYCFVRQQDYSAPEPPQKLSPEAFLGWLAKQLKLAREVVVCYEAGCFGYEPARRMEAMGARSWSSRRRTGTSRASGRSTTSSMRG